MGRADQGRRSRFLRHPLRPAGAGIPLDRLLRQPGAGEPADGTVAGGCVRPPQRRQPGGAHRLQLSVRAAICGRGAQGEAHHRLRPLRLWWRQGGDAEPGAGAHRQLAAQHQGRLLQIQRTARCHRRRAWALRLSVRAERGRAGGQRLPYHHHPERLAQGSGAGGTWLDLRHQGRFAARSRSLHQRSRADPGRLPRLAGHASAAPPPLRIRPWLQPSTCR